MYVKKQAGKLLKGLGIVSDAIIHPELHKLLLVEAFTDVDVASDTTFPQGTVATMIIVLPSQYEVIVTLPSGTHACKHSIECKNALECKPALALTPQCPQAGLCSPSLWPKLAYDSL